MPTNFNSNYLTFSTLVSRAGDDARILATGAIDFTSDTQFVLNLQATIQAAKLAHPIQAVYIDCSTIAFGSTTLTMIGSGQRITIAAGAQGYYPVLISSNTFVFTLTNTGNVGQSKGSASCYLYFVNVPMVPAEWNTVRNATTGGGGNMMGPVRVVSTAIDLATISDYTLLCDCAAANGTITEYLPQALGGFQTFILNIVKRDATNNIVAINANGATFANTAAIGGASATQLNLSVPMQSVTLQWTGGAWQVLSSFPGNYRGLGNSIAAYEDLRDTGGGWFRWFVDAATAYGGAVVNGWQDLSLNRIVGGFDANSWFVANYGLNVTNAANIQLGSNWTAWAPTITALSPMIAAGANVSVGVSDFLRIGPIVHFRLFFIALLSGSATNKVYASMPVLMGSASPNLYGTCAISLDNESQYTPAVLVQEQATSRFIFCLPGMSNFVPGHYYAFQAQGSYRCA
jgi:hypothetical protein